MRFELSEEQLALRDAARELLDTGSTSARVRQVAAGSDGMDRELWQQMVEQGWPAVALAETAGGLGLGPVEVAVLCHEVGRHVAPAPFLSTALAVRGLAAAGRDEWVDRLTGGAVGAVGWRDAPVVDAPVADVVLTVHDDEVRWHVTDQARPAAEPAMDITRRLGRVGSAGEWLGDARLAGHLMDHAAVGYAAELLGLAERMLAEAVSYAKLREQFGRPIGSFQAVKHRLADMHVDVEGMWSAVYYAAWALGAEAPDATLAAATAKAWCSEAGPRVLHDALQVHGGIGFTWEHDLHLYLKRAQLDAVSFGDASWHRARVLGLLRQRLADGTGLF